MSATSFFEKALPDYKGGAQKFTLSVAEKDGLVIVGLSTDTDNRACTMEPDEARNLIAALQDALTRVNYK